MSILSVHKVTETLGTRGHHSICSYLDCRGSGLLTQVEVQCGSLKRKRASFDTQSDWEPNDKTFDHQNRNSAHDYNHYIIGPNGIVFRS